MKKTVIRIICLFIVFSIIHPQAILASDSEVASPVSYTGDASKPVTDTAKPVIEEIEFPDNGKTVDAGSRLPIYVKAYDADSAIRQVRVSVSYPVSGESFSEGEEFDLFYNEETKRYEGNIVVKNKDNPNVSIGSIRVIDEAGNYADGIVRDDEYKPLYTFKVVNGKVDDKEIVMDVNTIEFSQNTKTLNHEDKMNLSFTLPKEYSDAYKDVNAVEVVFVNENGSRIGIYLNQDGSDITKFIGEDSIGLHLSSGKYVLKDISLLALHVKQGTVKFKNSESIWFSLSEKSDTIKPVITSIEMDKNGEFVNVGDLLTIRVKASDNVSLLKGEHSTYLDFSPSASISASSLRVNLSYKDSTDEFVGQLEIPEGLYPCEWYISNMSVSDSSGNQAESSNILGRSDPYYFKVRNGETFVNPLYDIHINAYALDEKGNYVPINEWAKKGVERRTTLKEVNYVFPDGSTTYEGLVFKGWVDSVGNSVNENTEILSSNLGMIYATYDKIVIQNNYSFPKSDLSYGSLTENIIVSPNDTYKDVIEKARGIKIDNMYTGEVFEKWDVSMFNQGIDLNSVIKCNPSSNIQYNALYKGKKAVRIASYYFDESAHNGNKERVVLVDDGTVYATILAQLDEKTPVLFKGLRFKAWEQYSWHGVGKVTQNYTSINEIARYENYIVRFMLSPRQKSRSNIAITGASGDDSKYDIFAVVVEPGGTLSIPEFKGYSNVEWVDTIPENNLSIHKDIDFYGVGNKVSNPTNPEEPTNPEKPVNPDTPIVKPDNTGATVSNKIPEKIVKETVDKIQIANAGDTISLDMEEATVISKEILDAAKGKDIIVELVMVGYTWSIHGKDIVATNLEDINLEVSFNGDKIPSKTIRELAGDNPIKQLSLTHNGNFGFKAQLSFNIGSEYNGKYGNLFYYDSEGVLVFINAGKIDENGNVSLSFSHASEYVIVINEKVMENKYDDAMKATGNENKDIMFACLSALLLVIMITLVNKKKKA